MCSHRETQRTVIGQVLRHTGTPAFGGFFGESVDVVCGQAGVTVNFDENDHSPTHPAFACERSPAITDSVVSVPTPSLCAGARSRCPPPSDRRITPSNSQGHRL